MARPLQTSWLDVGKDCRRAAQSLKERYPRSSVSRAYYAVFAVLNHRLLSHESPLPRYETHLHRRIPDLIDAYLLQRDMKTRRVLRTTVVRLYNARLGADYKLTRTVDESVALSALRDAKSIFRILGIDDA